MSSTADPAPASAPAVLIERDGCAAILTLNRPQHRNSLDAELVTALGRAFDEVERDPEVLGVVLTGTGSAFCAGAVLDTLIAAADGGFDDVVGVYEGFLRVLRSPLPVVAAVNGPAVGAGLNLALAADVRIAATTARFESRFPQLRLHPGGGHTWLLGRAVGRETATRMALFGEPLSAEQALHARLVSEVVEPDALRERAVQLVQRLGGMERGFVGATVASLREAEQTPEHGAMLAVETERQRWSTTRPEFVRNTTELRDRIRSR